MLLNIFFKGETLFLEQLNRISSQPTRCSISVKEKPKSYNLMDINLEVQVADWLASH